MKPKKINISVGIFCHNEEVNVEKAIQSVLASHTTIAVIKEIIVISSGSFDKTNRIVRSFAKKDKRVQLHDEAERSGKSSAINQFIRLAHSEILISLSGDLKVKRDAIEEIAEMFTNPNIGMVGARPVPLNWRYSHIGKELALLWELHHRLSLIKPKCGEMVAFRNVIRQIPIDSAVDEANIEVLLRLIGFTIAYAPRAIVYNKVPLTLKELLIQRRRVYSGHLWLSEKYNYNVSTMQQAPLLKAVSGYLEDNPTEFPVLLRLVAIEVISRILGWFDYTVLGKNPYKWDMVRR